jgi:hypothetical protein
MQYCIVELLGAGGGGGVSSNNESTSYSAWGGAAGGYSKSFYNSATIGTSQPISVGAGGAGVGLYQNAGNGGNSTFGTLMTAGGGAGGVVVNGNAPASSGGIATGGNICNVNGQNSTAILRPSEEVPTYIVGLPTTAASSLYGTAGQNYYSLTTIPEGQNGQNGQGNGSGGGCGGSMGGAAATGGNGADGLCIITEYIGG